MADTKIDEYKISSAEEWQKLIHDLDIVQRIASGETVTQEEMESVDRETLARKIEVIFPELKDDIKTGLNNIWGKAQSKAISKLNEIKEVNVPENIKEMRRRFEEARRKSSEDTRTVAEKVAALNAQSKIVRDKIAAEKLPVVEPTGVIISDRKPEEVTEETVDADKRPISQPRSEQMKKVEAAIQRIEERAAKRDLTPLEDPGKFAQKIAKGFVGQIIRQERTEKAPSVSQEQTGILGKISGVVASVVPGKKTEDIKSVDSPTRRSGDEPKAIQRAKEKARYQAMAESDTTSRAGVISSAVITAQNSVKQAITNIRNNIIGVGVKQEPKTSSAVDLAINRSRFDKPNAPKRTEQVSRIADVKGIGAASKSVSGRVGGGGSVTGILKSLRSNPGGSILDGWFASVKIISGGVFGFTNIFPSIMSGWMLPFFIIFLACTLGLAGLTFYMMGLKKSPFVNYATAGPSADLKYTPAIPTSISKTAVLSGNKINYTLNKGGITNLVEDDVIKVVDSSNKVVTSSVNATDNYSFDVSGLNNVSVINTYTVKSGTFGSQSIKNLTATTVTVIGNGPLETIACPIVGTRQVSLKSLNAGGHCAPGYPALDVCPQGSNPWPGNEMANDIVGQNMVGTPVILPALVGNNGQLQKVTWVYSRTSTDPYNFTDPATKLTQKQNFIEYAGKTTDGKEYLIQLHHLFNVDSTKTTSGEVVGYEAGFDGNESSPHTHVQIAIKNSAGVWSFQPAENYLQNCANWAF